MHQNQPANKGRPFRYESCASLQYRTNCRHNIGWRCVQFCCSITSTHVACVIVFICHSFSHPFVKEKERRLGENLTVFPLCFIYTPLFKCQLINDRLSCCIASIIIVSSSRFIFSYWKIGVFIIIVSGLTRRYTRFSWRSIGFNIG